MTLIEDFGTRLAGIGRPDEADAQHLTLHVVDTIGTMLAGSRSSEGREILHFLAPGGHGAPSMESMLSRVTAHSAITRLTEIDNIHLTSGTTPSAIIVPTALAFCCHVSDPTPEDFSAGVLAGLEAMTRFGEAIDGPNLIYKGVWTTFLTAPIGAAATGARILGLDATATAHAIAIAITSMAGRIGQPGLGKTARWLMAGQAARAGAFAAIAAANGFKGDLSLLDGGWISQAQGFVFDRDRLKASFAGNLAIGELSVKPFCSAKQVLAAAAAFEQALSTGFRPEKIDSVLVEVPETYRGMIDHGVVVGDRLSSVTSAPYQLALVAQAPDGLFDIERRELVSTGAVRALMDKVKVKADAELASYLPGRWPARVTISGGERTEQVTVIDAPGDPGAPLSLEQVDTKFRRFAARADLKPEQINSWVASATAATQRPEPLAALVELYRTM